MWRFIETKRKIDRIYVQSVVYGSETWSMRMRVMKAGEGGENDDKIDVLSDIKGQIQE